MTFNTYTQLLTLTQLLLIITLQTPISSASPPLKKPFTKIYAFGDSYTDTGNIATTIGRPANYRSNFPYGTTFFHHPTNRLSDGRLVIDFVAEHLALPFLPPYRTITNIDKSTNGVNFAVAGSTAIEYRFFVKRNITFDTTKEHLGTELKWFNTFLEKQGCGNDLIKCSALFNDALIWVGEIGGNDYGYSSKSSVDQRIILGLAIKRISGFLEAVLKKGAKYVVVQGLPPTGCLTLSIILTPKNDRDDIGCAGTPNILSSIHNKLLQVKIAGLRKQFPGAFIVYADYYNAYREIIRNRAKYGFKEAFKVCCGSGGGEYNYDLVTACGSKGSRSCPDPSRYINWDGVHLTEGMYKVVSELLLQGGFSQPAFQEMVNKKMKLSQVK